MNKKPLAFLVCPVCHGQLVYQCKQNELICHEDDLAFPIRHRIPVLMEHDARRLTGVSVSANKNKSSRQDHT